MLEDPWKQCKKIVGKDWDFVIVKALPGYSPERGKQKGRIREQKNIGPTVIIEGKSSQL